MALRGTLVHRKIRRLAIALKISPCYALGICEALWHVTAQHAPAGDIGRMSDSDIAMEMFYDEKSADLIVALVEVKLLDRNKDGLLIVHDWHLHSEDSVDNRLARAGKYYASGEQPRMTRLNILERTKLCALHGYVMPAGTNRPVSRSPSAQSTPESSPTPVIKTSVPSLSPVREAVERAFTVYLTMRGLTENDYSLTEDRRKSAEKRLRERLHARLNNLAKAEEDLAAAIHNTLAHQWNRDQGLIDWGDHIFRTREQFQKQLNFKGGVNAANKGNSNTGKPSPAIQRQQSSFDAIRAAATARYGGGAGGDDGPNSGPVPEPRNVTPDSHYVPVAMGEDSHAVRPGNVHPRIIEAAR